MVYNFQKYWIEATLSKGPNRIGFFPSPEDGNRSSFRNVVFLLSLFLIPGRWIRSENPISPKYNKNIRFV
jgi:hypothetical protein